VAHRRRHLDAIATPLTLPRPSAPAAAAAAGRN